MEIVYSIFIGIIVGMNASKIDGIGLQCRRDSFHFKHSEQDSCVGAGSAVGPYGG
jgi:hypothetical protein